MDDFEQVLAILRLRDGGETYLLRDLKCKFENEGIVDENFNDALEECLLQGWIIDCGNGIYTH